MEADPRRLAGYYERFATHRKPNSRTGVSRWGHQPDFSGGFLVWILIPPCWDQNHFLAPRPIKCADDLLQIRMRQARVDLSELRGTPKTLC